MAGGSAVVRSPDPRVSTGVPSLDAMLEGGLVAHRPYLIVGASGTGKTTVGIQFLCEGVRRGERVLLVTLEEPPNEARVNHRGLEPELGRVEVFDAIPDIMRYERTPFKDIASVRTAVPFSQVPLRIRQSPELASVEVTITALEQMLRTEVIRRGYTRLVVDSLTALQYFCMKGFDPVAGAQSFLRFLSDLRVTTLLTVEAPLEDIETPERMLARGEIRLFRWELDGQTVRAIGVEKFRGSSHDVRLHPYRIGPQGIDINLDVTISRDTRQIIEPIVPPAHLPVAAPAATFASAVTPLMDEVRDLILIGADVAAARSEIEAALSATNEGHPEEARAHLARVSSLVMVLVDQLSHGPGPAASGDVSSVAAFQRVLARADTVRTGVPPTSLPPPAVLQVQLAALLSLLPAAAPLPAPETAVVAVPPAPPGPAPPSEAPAPVEPIGPEPGVGPPPTREVEPSPSTLPTPEPPAPPEPAAVEAVPVPVPAPSEEHRPPGSATPTASPREGVGLPPTPAPVETAAPAPAPPLPASSEEGKAPALLPREEPTAPIPPPEPPTKRARALPAPPKPRPVVSPPRPTRPPPAPAARPPPVKAGPPPLPSTAVPAWPEPSTAPSPAHAGSHATAVRSAAATVPSAGRAGGAAAKKRRRPSAPTAKKAAPHARAPAPRGGHATTPLAPQPSPPPPPAAPAPPSPPPPPAAPGGGAPPPESPAATVPKPRRRPARKRKAPPVVSAIVEPLPDGAVRGTDERPDPPEEPRGSPSLEG